MGRLNDTRVKTCKVCKSEFKYSKDRKLTCLPCRNIASRTPCLSCGEPSHQSHDFCKLCVDRSGSNNNNYKGGSRYLSKGYVMLKIEGKFMYEHRKIMSEHLGRELLAKETVHHLNGVKTDNRLENLELWSSSHPAGQRVSDKVAWAKELLRLYEPDSLA